MLKPKLGLIIALAVMLVPAQALADLRDYTLCIHILTRCGRDMCGGAGYCVDGDGDGTVDSCSDDGGMAIATCEDLLAL